MIFCPSAHGILAVTAAVTPSGVTWNPADKNSNTTLSNGNLTATGGGIGAGEVRATVARSTGKFYWEVVLTAGPFSNLPYLGIRPSANTLTGNGPFDGGGEYGCFVRSPNDAHQDYQPGGNLSTVGPAVATSDVFMFAVDLANLKFWIGRNGTFDASGDPAAGTNAITITSGTWAPWASLGITSASVTARFASASWGYSAPSGFSEWS